MKNLYKIFDKLDFSNLISIKKDLPLCKKIVDGLNVSELRKEMMVFDDNMKKISKKIKNDQQIPKKMWWNYLNIDSDEALSLLYDVDFLEKYRIWHMCKFDSSLPWNNLHRSIGQYTKSLLSTFNFHRPRYVECHPGWELKEHIDWSSNKKNGLRCHLMIDTNEKCIHSVRDSNGNLHEFNFLPGEIWFLNVEFPHRAYNLGDTVRTSISFELFDDSMI
jgi:hypothetical protein